MLTNNVTMDLLMKKGIFCPGTPMGGFVRLNPRVSGQASCVLTLNGTMLYQFVYGVTALVNNVSYDVSNASKGLSSIFHEKFVINPSFPLQAGKEVIIPFQIRLPSNLHPSFVSENDFKTNITYSLTATVTGLDGSMQSFATGIFIGTTPLPMSVPIAGAGGGRATTCCISKGPVIIKAAILASQIPINSSHLPVVLQVVNSSSKIIPKLTITMFRKTSFTSPKGVRGSCIRRVQVNILPDIPPNSSSFKKHLLPLNPARIGFAPTLYTENVQCDYFLMITTNDAGACSSFPSVTVPFYLTTEETKVDMVPTFAADATILPEALLVSNARVTGPALKPMQLSRLEDVKPLNVAFLEAEIANLHNYPVATEDDTSEFDEYAFTHEFLV